MDIKTSNGIYDEMKLQVVAYMHAGQEESGEKYDGRWIIRLGKELDEEGNAILEAKYLDDTKSAFKQDFAAFVHTMGLHRWQQAQSKAYYG